MSEEEKKGENPDLKTVYVYDLDKLEGKVGERFDKIDKQLENFGEKINDIDKEVVRIATQWSMSLKFGGGVLSILTIVAGLVIWWLKST